MSEHLAAIRRVIATTTADAGMYTDELLSESLRQALREYAEMAPPVETVLAEHEGLLALGAAGWAAELHYRQVAEAVKGPTAEQIKRMYTWGYLRLSEFRDGLKDLRQQAGAAVVRPAWGRIGL